VVSTAVTLMGMALLYGSTGTLSYAGLSRELDDPSVPGAVVSVGVVLTIVGLLFKLGAVPFHVWVPDTYRGASVMVAGFLASVSKSAALGALLVLLALGLGPADDSWQPVIAIVAAVTMTIGNLGALRQRDGVAMLAWSSVAQAGFLIAPAAAIFTTSGLSAPLQYLAVYALANIIAFAALAVVLRTRGSTSYDELAGLARTDPWLGLPLAFAVLTLAGFPPAVAGLVTKYVVMRPVVDGDVTWLAVVMAINVMLGLAYYLRLVVVVASPATGKPVESRSAPYAVRLATATVAAGTLGLVALSVWPNLLIANLP
jgi:NADH-quinone oxidoreductase subunit N